MQSFCNGDGLSVVPKGLCGPSAGFSKPPHSATLPPLRPRGNNVFSMPSKTVSNRCPVLSPKRCGKHDRRLSLNRAYFNCDITLPPRSTTSRNAIDHRLGSARHRCYRNDSAHGANADAHRSNGNLRASRKCLALLMRRQRRGSFSIHDSLSVPQIRRKARENLG